MHQIIRSAKMHGLQELDGFPRSRWILSAGIQAESKILHFHSPDICTMEQHDAKGVYSTYSMYLYVCVNSALQVGHQISLGKTYIFSTSRPPPLGTSLHSQALVFPVFVWLSIIAASTSGIVFSSELGTPAKSATSFYCDGFLTRLYCHAPSLRSMAHSISS